MQIDLNGRRLVVAGGSRGIGRAIALAAARAGASVSACARGQEALATLHDELARLGVPAHVASCDLADRTAIAHYVDEAARALGGIDVLVNNASAFGGSNDEDGWGRSFGVDLMAVVRASELALPYLKAGQGPSIINLSSISALRPSVRTAPYAAIKAAVSHYTTSQAAALAPLGIRVNAIAPGSIEFPGGAWADRRTSDPALYGRILRSIPFGRLGTPEEVAHVAVFLASPLASWITGQTIVVDGGQLLG
jgi:3-oxoacyl-[acyl-carrier protein] reductase